MCESAAAMYIHIVTLGVAVVLFLLPGTDVLSFTKRGEALKLPSWSAFWTQTDFESAAHADVFNFRHRRT